MTSEEGVKGDFEDRLQRVEEKLKILASAIEKIVEKEEAPEPGS